MNKKVYRYSDIRQKIDEAIDLISSPVRQTIGPKGRNVLFQDARGGMYSTNDGATIVKQMAFKDPVINAIVDAIKQSSLRTNTEVGDGTSTSIILTATAIKEGFKMIDNGMNPMYVKKEFIKFGEALVENLKKKSIKIKDDKDLMNIATISANNDKEIAKDTVKAVKVAGLDGMIFIEPNNKPETEVIEDKGFLIPSGLHSAELRNSNTSMTATYFSVPVLITDKRLYYKEEAETILSTVIEAGFKQVVIVARDFIGEAVNVFIANHTQKYCNVLLVKDPSADGKNVDALEDLAAYLGGKVVSEKTGRLVDNLKIEDFCFAAKAFSDPVKTIITPKVKASKALTDRITSIRKALAKDKEDETLKKRLASLTNGMVTVKVGAATNIELSEKIFRFEDAISATRAAMEDGYLVGGGTAIMNAFDPKKYPAEFVPSFRKFTQANVRQIAENCGQHADNILASIFQSSNSNVGFNALTEKVEDLLVAGVIDPYKVTEMTIMNSLSIAMEIVSSDYLIVNDTEDDSDSTNNKTNNKNK